jgi:hypothetical protein
MIIARQSTALELAIGPVLDADGVAVTGGVVGDFKLKKTTGNFAALNGSATLTHVSAGIYDLVLTTSDTDTVGLCAVAIDDTTNGCATVYIQVIEEAVYDALFAASAAGFASITALASAQTDLDTLTAPFDGTVGAHHPYGIVDSGTAQSVGANEIVIRAGAAFVDNALRGCTVLITNGTQVGSRAICASNTAADDTLVLSDWTGATPTGTPTYVIFGSAAGEGVAQTGDAYAVLTTAVADSVPADGSRPTISQALYMVTQFLLERSVSGTEVTVYKPDGTTVLMVLTLSDATNPTSITRTT